MKGVTMPRPIVSLVVVLVFCLTLAGCAAPKADSGPGSTVGTAKDNASIVTCRTNRAQLDQQYSMAQSAAEAPADFAALVEQVGAKCPSGGAYSLDATTGKTRCSVHGE